MTTKTAERARSRTLKSVPADKPTGTPVPADPQLLTIAGKPAQTQRKPAAKPAPKPAAKAEPKLQAATAAKSAPAPKGPTASDKRNTALSALIAAAGDLVTEWDEQSTGISADEAREFIAHRLAYCGPQVQWDDRLGQRPMIASRTGKSTAA